jgi:hypothetical protein
MVTVFLRSVERRFSASPPAPVAASGVASQIAVAPSQALSAASLSPYQPIAGGDSGSRCDRRQGSNTPVARCSRALLAQRSQRLCEQRASHHMLLRLVSGWPHRRRIQPQQRQAVPDIRRKRLQRSVVSAGVGGDREHGGREAFEQPQHVGGAPITRRGHRHEHRSQQRPQKLVVDLGRRWRIGQRPKSPERPKRKRFLFQVPWGFSMEVLIFRSSLIWLAYPSAGSGAPDEAVVLPAKTWSP